MVVGILLVFFLGLLTGALGTEFYHRTLYSHFKKDPAARKSYIMKKLTARLDLSEKQQQAFGAMIDRIDAQRRAQSVKRRAEIRKMMDANFKEMKKGLNPDQQLKFDALVQEIRKRKKK